ncbi:MAG: CRTAC1 family protein [Limisphaerales bacterium]
MTSVRAATGLPWFEEVGASSGVDFRHTSGHRDRFLMPEINTGGVALLDFDGDGLLDVFCVNGGFADPGLPGRPPGHRLYRNQGGWRFDDVTERAGVGANPGYGMGAACGDYDGDGWTDLYVLNLRKNVLYRNRGDGTFEDTTARAGVAGDTWSSSAAFFDFDRDGLLDLFVVNYIHWSMASEVPCSSRGGIPDYCSPLSYRAPAPDRIYRNRGDGTFEDATERLGIDRASGNGLGVATGDFDGDGWVDVFVANDATSNQLWMNKAGRRFEDEALVRGCALNAVGVPRAGMGVAVVDLTGRGAWDLFVTHLVGEGSGWFANEKGHFTDRITVRGPTRGSLPFTGFGVGFRDFDHDGEWDLFAANGRVRLGATDLDPGDPYAEPNLLLRGLGAAEFEEVPLAGGTAPGLVAASRGVAFGDLDNDGDDDVVILNKDGPVHVLRNLAGSRGRWLGLDIRDDRGGVARNATVRVESGGRWRARQVQPNEGYASSHDPRLIFGLGTASVAGRVVVRWTDGREDEFGPLEADRYHRMVPRTRRGG